MIFGVGTDLVEVVRIERALARHGERFAWRILMPHEFAQYQATSRKTRFLALRFAAKEAIVKAMGTGFAHGMWVRDVGVQPDQRGRPDVVYSDRGRAVCRKLGIGTGYVSLCDEAGLALAFAVLLRADGGAEQ